MNKVFVVSVVAAACVFAANAGAKEVDLPLYFQTSVIT